MKIKKIIGIITIASMMVVMSIAPVLATQNTSRTSSETTNTNTASTTTTNQATANVPKTITKDYTFTTDIKPFKYEPPKTVTQGDYKYEYKDKITYKENSTTQPVKQTKTFTDLTSRSVPNSIIMNGKTLYLSGNPTYTSHTTPAKKSTKTVTDTKTYKGVVPGTESSVIKNEVEKDGVTLKKTNQTYSTSNESFTASGSLASYDHDYHVSGTSIQLTDSHPQQGNWREDLREYFELPSSTTITAAAWSSDIQHNTGSNKYTRGIKYSGTRTVYDYTVNYSGTKTVTDTPEKTTYSATATYESKEKTQYNVTATVTYEMTQESLAALEQQEKTEQERIEQEQKEEQEQLEQERIEKEEQEQAEKEAEEELQRQEQAHKRNIIIGSSLGVLALLGLIAALVLTRRKKPEDDGDDLNALFAKASAIKTNKNTAKKESEKQRAAEQKKEQARKEKEEKARKAEEEKERRRLEKQRAYEQKKMENAQRNNSPEKSDFMKKLDQIKHDIATDDEIKK